MDRLLSITPPPLRRQPETSGRSHSSSRHRRRSSSLRSSSSSTHQDASHIRTDEKAGSRDEKGKHPLRGQANLRWVYDESSGTWRRGVSRVRQGSASPAALSPPKSFAALCEEDQPHTQDQPYALVEADQSRPGAADLLTKSIRHESVKDASSSTATSTRNVLPLKVQRPVRHRSLAESVRAHLERTGVRHVTGAGLHAFRASTDFVRSSDEGAQVEKSGAPRPLEHDSHEGALQDSSRSDAHFPSRYGDHDDTSVLPPSSDDVRGPSGARTRLLTRLADARRALAETLTVVPEHTDTLGDHVVNVPSASSHSGGVSATDALDMQKMEVRLRARLVVAQSAVATVAGAETETDARESALRAQLRRK
ncbi:hypothetical protein K488DRAFT_90712 [Vararia minispora EC-137]|uniref:Uncharacterized protein n=1 Tax=Vararia minispora EC-137 TaxID=1314806 RepID=A0ACB8Q7F3_9AGAM|nr:hypothetical protein K488DRAFT_90712 [Vararia minispora EC-137]